TKPRASLNGSVRVKYVRCKAHRRIHISALPHHVNNRLRRCYTGAARGLLRSIPPPVVSRTQLARLRISRRPLSLITARQQTFTGGASGYLRRITRAARAGAQPPSNPPTPPTSIRQKRPPEIPKVGSQGAPGG